MCGITGFLCLTPEPDGDQLQARVLRMADVLAHRGPDQRGAWVDPAAGIALGFRRLSILDLSPTGNQPMQSHSGRYVIVYNGEVYNHAQLRHELEDLGCREAYRGTSDSEVMLAAIEQFGVPVALKRFNGMFAFALWDRQARQLYLCRDRLGIKPLYYAWAGSTLLFASELKALRQYPGFQAQIDRQALALYLRDGCVPAPHSIYSGVKKLLPGTLLVVSAGVAAGSEQAAEYWSARQVAERGVHTPFAGSAEEACAALQALLSESIQQRMVADVPLGAFLSGGIDSSTVVALMQVNSSRPVKTFTVGFDIPDYNEARYAAAVARHLGTEHTELTLSTQETLQCIPLLPQLYDEPFADSSQIPTYLVARMARSQVAVCLSGDGGDELFGGYNRYTWLPRIWRTLGWIPAPLRRMKAAALGALLASPLRNLMARKPAQEGGIPQLVDKLEKVRQVLASTDRFAAYEALRTIWKAPQEVVLGLPEMPGQRRMPDLADFTQWMMYMDMTTYLPDDILTKLDRASMGVSLEARAPFLDDHRVAEFAWQLPLQMKIRNGQGKWLLRQLLYRFVPPALLERPKMGFSIPLDAWLRGDLRPWAEELLSAERMQADGYLDPIPVRRMWAEHLSRRHNRQDALWCILMFQAWLSQQ